ncbi:unnamed protein product [Pseudo-nitzschia multistriata]|uniref:Cyanocobalamin reductase (cyanide-eliminating) n=1 Tax=Pseudo-nitzschia multistriata TaxID=183589 RepID=A0A448ZT37_9STRA|nr:unnamed protein product [Pseudo-nitzschia multistriata]
MEREARTKCKHHRQHKPQRKLADALRCAGFDIFHGPFSPKKYNDLLECEGLEGLSRLPEERRCTGSSGSNSSGSNSDYEAYLIGNTKHLWPVFLDWLQLRRQSAASTATATATTTASSIEAHPLDTYERTAIERVVRESLGPDEEKGKGKDANCNTNCDTNACRCYELFFSSDLGTGLVSMARVASCSGFSYLDPHTHLSIHPRYGTWHSYRAVLLLASEGLPPGLFETGTKTETPILTPIQNPLSPIDARKSRKAFDRALAITTGTTTDELMDEAMEELCEMLGAGLYRDVRDERQEENDNDNNNKTKSKNETVAAAWIALRDSISIGREDYRFGTNQLLYHYTKDPRHLLP